MGWEDEGYANEEEYEEDLDDEDAEEEKQNLMEQDQEKAGEISNDMGDDYDALQEKIDKFKEKIGNALDEFPPP